MAPRQKWCLITFLCGMCPVLRNSRSVSDESDLGIMQVTHLAALRVLVFLVTPAEFIAHRHLNVQQSSAFMERNSLNIVNPSFFLNGLWLSHPPLTF